MTRAEGIRVPIAALVVLVAATGLVFGLTRGWFDGSEVAHRSETAPVASPASEARDDRMLVRVRVLSDGDLLVRHWIHSSTPLTSLALATPVDPNLSAGIVTATGLRVRVGRVLVEGATSLHNETAAFVFDESDSVRVRYVLSGALERAAPTDARALARVTSLEVFYDARSGPVTYVFQGARVLALACTPVGGDLPTPCGRRRGDEWVVEVPYPASGRYSVMAQLDLLD